MRLGPELADGDKKAARGPPFCAVPGQPARHRLPSATRLFRLAAVARRELFADARRLAGAVAQVVELGAAHVAVALHFDRRDQRRIGLERALHAFAAGDLAHGERRVEAAVALGDHHAFVGLHALALAFDDVDVDDRRCRRARSRGSSCPGARFLPARAFR